MIRLPNPAGLAARGFGGPAPGAIASDIRGIGALCGVGFGLTHPGPAALIGRLPPTRSAL